MRSRTGPRGALALAALSGLATLTCGPGGSTLWARTPNATAGNARTVVIVALDGVRWQEVFGGADGALAERHGLDSSERLGAAQLVPNLTRLMTAEGVAVGAPGVDSPMEASGPNFVSLPGYMEMLTGSSDPGCTNNHCGQVALRTVADDVAEAGLGEAVVVSSWPVIMKAAAEEPRRIAASVGRHGGGASRDVLERDTVVARAIAAGERTASAVGEKDFRRDSETGDVALAVLEARRPAFLFVGLGEPDEYAHQGDYRGYLGAIRRDDAIVGKIADWVRRANTSGHPTTLMVTTDHGRSFAFTDHGKEHPESARVWMVASGEGVHARGAVASPKVRHLADVGQTARALLGLSLAAVDGAGHRLSELTAPSPRGPRVAAR